VILLLGSIPNIVTLSFDFVLRSSQDGEQSRTTQDSEFVELSNYAFVQVDTARVRGYNGPRNYDDWATTIAVKS